MLSIVKMSELSDRSGVAIPTIKFYLRESLLAPGERTSPNQSSYNESHVARLTLVRSLIDVGGLSVAAVRDVLAAIENTELPVDWAFGVAQRAIPRALDGVDARLTVDVGIRVSDQNPGLPMVARVLDAYDALGFEELAEALPAYVEAARIIARADLAAVRNSDARPRMISGVVIGTVLGDTLLAGLRRMAQEELSVGTAPEGDC